MTTVGGGQEEVNWLDPAELEAWIGLITLSSRLVALCDTELRRDANITGRDYELLHHLSVATDGLRINELGQRIDDSSSCITHRVNRLAAAGLVAKVADPGDRRARRVALTGEGRNLLERTAPRHVARVRRWIFDALDHGDVHDLGRLVAMLTAHLRRIEPANAAPGGT